MTRDEFVDAFAERLGVSPEDAQKHLRAAFEVLSERISRGELRHVASQLPRDIADLMAPDGEEAEAFEPDEFVTRVVERTGADARFGYLVVRALFTTLRQALTSGEYDDLMSQLPRVYRSLVPGTNWRGGPIPAWGVEQ